jgi:hypothetical protein
MVTIGHKRDYVLYEEGRDVETVFIIGRDHVLCEAEERVEHQSYNTTHHNQKLVI